MKKHLFISIISLFCLFTILPWLSEAQMPKKVNYQGYLADTAGNPVDGSVQMTFSIYDVATGGSSLWSETQAVTATEGRYSVLLGAVTPISLTEVKPYWLGIKVGSDSEMTPRKEITPTLYEVILDGSSSSADSDWIESNGNIYRDTGNVGVGTAQPRDKLEIAGKIRISNPDGTQGHIYSENWDGGNFLIRGLTKHLTLFTQQSGRVRFTDADGIEKVSILNSGNVGIGTTNPGAKLHVNGTIKWGNATLDYHYPYNEIRWGDNTGWYLSFVRQSDGKHLVDIRDNGNMDVNGRIKTREVLVTNSGWADFVFDDDYTLMPLSQVEQHIKTHKHLPDIPSEQEVLEKGISLGEMQARLLQKIEELTLHLIELEKENNQLKSRISTLESFVEDVR